MKRITLIIFAICIFAGQHTINAQSQGHKRPDPEQMTQFAVDRMAKELALDDATTAKFAEVYKAYLNDKFALMREYRDLRGEDSRNQDVSGERGRRHETQNEDSAAEQIVKSFERRQKAIEMEQKQLALDIQYCEKFNKVLNPKQILKLYERQNNFGRPQTSGQRPQPRGPQGGRPGGQSWPSTSNDWNE